MANLQSNNSDFKNTTVNIDSDSISILIGNTIIINAGFVNQVYIGNRTAFLLGSQMEANIGAVNRFIAGPTMSVLFGGSYVWSKQDSAIHDTSSRWGALSNSSYGGLSASDYAKRLTENQVGALTLIAVLVGYCALIGITIVGIEYPPFNQTNSDGISRQNKEITYITDGMGTIIISLTEYFMTKKFKDKTSVNPVANSVLASNGITDWVLSEPDDPTSSPIATFFMQPDSTWMPPGEPLVEATNPTINLSTSKFTDLGEIGSYISMDPNSIIFDSKGAQVAIDQASKSIIIRNDGDAGNSNFIRVEKNASTSIRRDNGTIIAAVGSDETAAVGSSLLLDMNKASLLSNNNGITIDKTSVSVGTATSSLTFDASGITIGGIKITPGMVDISSGAIQVLGASPPPNPIPAKANITANLITFCNRDLLVYITAIEEKIYQLKMQIEGLQLQAQEAAVTGQR